LAALGLTAVDGMTQVWFAHPDGRLTGGAAAVNDALRTVWWARPFAWLYRLPGIKQLEDALYRWVAKNRYRLPGSSAQCRLDDKVSR
jgi:predicted DCC family thiol-disulfide oxidoreductase YuxK